MIDTAETALAAADPKTAAQLAVSIGGGDTVWRWREYQRFDPAAVSLFRRLLTELPTEHTVLGARLRAMLATELSYDPAHTGDADELCEQAVNQIRAATDRTPQDLARVLQARHLVLDRPRQLAHRLATAQELVRLAGAAADPAATGRALLFQLVQRPMPGHRGGESRTQRSRHHQDPRCPEADDGEEGLSCAGQRPRSYGRTLEIVEILYYTTVSNTRVNRPPSGAGHQ